MDGIATLARTEVLQARHNRLRTVAAFLAAVVVLIALLTLLAWIAQVPALLLMFHGVPPMRVNSATGALAAGVALWIRAREGNARAKRFATASAALTALIGAATALEYFLQVDIGIDDLLLADTFTPADVHPGRPAFDAALSLFFVGTALAVIDLRGMRFPAQVLAVLGGLLSYFALLAYAFSITTAPGPQSYSSMAIATAICLGLLSLGTVLARTDGPVLREVVNFNWAIGAALALLAVLLGVTAWTWWLARADRARDAQYEFAYETATLEGRLLSRLARNELVLTSGRALLGASDAVTREEWHRFVDTLQIEGTLPGVLGLGFAPRVWRGELDAHVAAIRAGGYPSYRVWPEGERAFYAPIVYLEPYPEYNLRAIGFDMFSEPVRRVAMVRAMDTGRTALSGAVRLVQQTGAEAQPGLLMYTPVYRRDVPTTTREERRAALIGFVYSPIRAGDFMRTTLEPTSPRVAMEVYDGAAAQPGALLYRQPGQSFGRRAHFRSGKSIDVGGQVWTLGFASTPEFEESLNRRTPEFILYGGTTISVLIFGIALALLTARRRAQALAERKTVELRITNERLVRQTRDLERSNAELEQFAYVASHDLREPLRTVTSFTQLLEEESGHALQGDARRYMQYIVDGNRRMKQLIDDLLSLSRVGSRTAPQVAVSSEEVVRESIEALSHAIRESGAVIHFEQLPEVVGDRLQLVQLFQNLLGNALKFRSADNPRVTITATRDEEWWQLAVADNGIGIDRKYFDRIFVIFQRLHGRDDYPGNGIGLAICKKIVERHGGLIWVESEPGRGATFYFTLRAASA